MLDPAYDHVLAPGLAPGPKSGPVHIPMVVVVIALGRVTVLVTSYRS